MADRTGSGAADRAPFKSIYVLLALMGGILALVATAVGNPIAQGVGFGVFGGGVLGGVLSHFGLLWRDEDAG